MSQLNFDLDQIRVVETTDTKGNTVLYLEIADQRILYTDPWEMLRSSFWNIYVSQKSGREPEIDTEMLADLFRHWLAKWLAEAMLAHWPEVKETWSLHSPTGREVRGDTPPRVALAEEE